MLYLPSESTTEFIEADPPDVCHLFRLSLELRDMVYRMLLTTKYCTQVTSDGKCLEFHLCTPILLTSKQISAEASRVLWEENHFVTLMITGVHLEKHDIPVFKLLAKERIFHPVLQAEVAIEKAGRLTEPVPVTLITTSEGLQSIICAIWRLQRHKKANPSTFHLGDILLFLKFNLKALARYETISNLVLKPWTKINGVKKLVLTGDIQDPMRERLQEHILKGPFPGEVAVCLREYISLAQKELARSKFRQRGGLATYDFSRAQWCWTILDDYWSYLWQLKPHRLGGVKLRKIDREFRTVLLEFLFPLLRKELTQVKTYLHAWQFRQAAGHIISLLTRYGCLRIDSKYSFTALMGSKLLLCLSLATTALGDIEVGMRCLEDMARELATRRQYCPECSEVLCRDLQIMVNSELVKIGSIYRCEWPPSVENIGRRMGWEEGEGAHSFWEWLDLPEE
jgi:hypothetical protein